MKLVLILASVILLSGCIATPVKRTFPEAPADLLKICPDLTAVAEGSDRLTEMLKVVTDNYSQYHECRVKNDLWIEWYKTQKEIFNSVK